MLGSFDNDMSGLLGGDGLELRYDLEILEEYLGGVLLPPLPSASIEPAAVWAPEATAENVLADVSEVEGPVPEVEVAASTSFTTSTMAEIYVSQGFIQRAIDIYEEMLRDNPTNDAIVQRIGELLEMLEETSADATGSEESPLAATATDPPSVSEAVGTESVVSTLEQWLNNINSSRRR